MSRPSSTEPPLGQAPAEAGRTDLAAELGASRDALARQAQRQAALAEITAALTGLREPSAVLQRTVDEAVHLLDAFGAGLGLIDPAGRVIRWAFDAGMDERTSRALRELDIPVGGGVVGAAFASRRLIVTGEYLSDTRFPHLPGPDRWIVETGVRSMVASPLPGVEGPLGILAIFNCGPDAYSDDDLATVETLAHQAAIALASARLIEELDRSRGEVEKRAAAERTLREIGAQLATLRDPEALLRRVVDEAARLVEADAVALDLVDHATNRTRWAYDAGIEDAALFDLVREGQPVDRGLVGLALSRGSIVATGEYLDDDQFSHMPEADEFMRRQGVRSMVAAPLPGEDGALGVLDLYSRQPNAFGPTELAIIAALAEQAAIALTNARLIDQLATSRAELEARAEAERTLREIAARITAVRDPEAVLQTIVDEARRLLGSDGAHLTLLNDDGAYLMPVVVAGGLDAETTAWLKQQRFPVGGGMNGLAAQLGTAVCTTDYLVDPRIPHGPEDHVSAKRLELRGMAVAPLRAPGGEIAGTLAISYREPRPIEEDAMELLQSLADQAAISVVNSRLDEALHLSEQRYRFLLENSPDIVFSCDADGRFSFLSETVERLTGWRVPELIGEPFSVLIQAASMPEALHRWALVAADPSLIQIFRLELRAKDGSTVPAELNSVGITVDGRFAGVHGSVRDLSEREQLERDLRHQAVELAASDERAHLARELHDSVTQALFSMTLQTRAAELLMAKDPSAAAEKLVTLRDLQRDALAEMRSLIFELRPGGIAEHGLVHALRTHAGAIQGRIGLPVTFDSGPGLDERLPLEVEESLYRIAQEAIHNVVKHAAASEVRMALERQDGWVRLSVVDDGVGFDPAAVPKGHLGLEGMRMRAEHHGGRIEITSRPHKGTVLAAILPVPGASA